ncbi:MAG: hypothetical protein IPN29_14405 [Saprospiraceae bacterium]|nr:hypothetical protein [Saprospiraceae bacterium]
MNKLITYLLLTLTAESLYGTQITVSNNPLRPAQYTSLVDAVAAASNNDTLLIAGSSTAYSGTINLTKSLTMIGEGINNPDGLSTTIGSDIWLKNESVSQGASGTKLIGIYFPGSLYINGDFPGATAPQRILANITIDRCRLSTVYPYAGIYNNFLIKNSLWINGNIFEQGAVTGSGFKIENCIFSNSYIQGGVTIYNFKNCIFMDRTSNSFITGVSAIKVEDCIFYKAEPTGAANSIFNNNITYLCNNNTLPPTTGTGNTGTGNLANTNPLFINYPALGAAFSWTHNYGLQAGSPALGAGTSGTNIGLTGGSYPLNQLKGYSQLPVVTSLSLPNSSVPVNGTIQGNIKAKARN